MYLKDSLTNSQVSRQVKGSFLRGRFKNYFLSSPTSSAFLFAMKETSNIFKTKNAKPQIAFFFITDPLLRQSSPQQSLHMSRTCLGDLLRILLLLSFLRNCSCQNLRNFSKEVQPHPAFGCSLRTAKIVLTLHRTTKYIMRLVTDDKSYLQKCPNSKKSRGKAKVAKGQRHV